MTFLDKLSKSGWLEPANWLLMISGLFVASVALFMACKLVLWLWSNIVGIGICAALVCVVIGLLIWQDNWSKRND